MKSFIFGELGVNAVPANSAVLLQSTSTKVNFVAFTGVKSTKAYDVVNTILVALLAEYNAAADFASQYGKVDNQKAGIDALKPFSKFLSGSVIYKSDNAGNLTKGLQMDDGLKLSQTALKITNKQLITTATGAVLKSAIYNQTKAIISQCAPFSTIESNITAINEAIAETEKEKAKAKKEESKEVKAA